MLGQNARVSSNVDEPAKLHGAQMPATELPCTSPVQNSAPPANTENTHTWDLTKLFATTDAWEAEFQALSREFSDIARYRNRVAESGNVLFEVLETMHRFAMRAELLENYASLGTFADTLDGDAQVRSSRASKLQSEVLASQAFIEPELLALPDGALAKFLETTPPLKPYLRYFENLERARPHILDSHAEALLAAFQPTLAEAESFYTALNNQDLRFQDITVNGASFSVHHGNIDTLIRSPDRQTRRAAFESHTAAYQGLPNSFAATLTQQAKSSLRFAQIRGFNSTLERNLFDEQFPETAFHVAAHMCDRLRPLMQRYFAAKADILGVKTIAEYDIHAPISSNAPVIQYSKAVELVLAAVAPLGDKYQAVARAGLCDLGWVDALPRENKYNNGLSAGVYGGQPYILMNYNGSVKDVGILAHELGHSVHSDLTHHAQPRCYANYAMTVAETASNLNQVLLRELLLQNGDRELNLAVIDEAFYTIHRYLFLFPTLSKIEHMVHSTYASGGAVSTDELRAYTVREFSDAYGTSVEFDPSAVGMRWAEYSHLFAPYYLFKYGVGMCAGMAIGQRILEGDTELRDRYLELLASGSSLSPVELFQHVDVDVNSPEPYERAFAVVESYLDRLEAM